MICIGHGPQKGNSEDFCCKHLRICIVARSSYLIPWAEQHLSGIPFSDLGMIFLGGKGCDDL